MIIKNQGEGVLTICLVVILLVLFTFSNSYSFPYKGLDIKIGGTISEMFDDNIFITTEKNEDFITRLSLGLGVRYEGKVRALEFDSYINQSIFARYHNNNNISGGLTLNFQNEFSKYDRIRLSNTFTHTFEPGSFEDEFGRTFGRYGTSHNRFNLIYNRDIGEQLAVIARYTNDLNKVSREGIRNSYHNSLGFGIDYTYSIATVFLLSYDFSKRRFENARETSTHTIGTGIRQYITQRLYLDGLVGIDFINTFEDKRETAEYITVSLTDDIDENTVANLSFTKRKQSFAYREELFDSWQTLGSFTRQLSERFGFSFSGFYGEGKFDISNITDKFLGTSITSTYDFSKNLKGIFIYTYSDYDSNVEDSVYTRNTVFSGLTMGF